MRFILLEPTLAMAAVVLATSFIPAGPALAQANAPQDMYAAPDNRRSEEQSYVTTAVVVRSGPSTRARIVGRLRRGDFVNIGECRQTWCEVDARGGSGWILGRFIGRGDNPYHDLGPAGPGIPRQEPGTYRPRERPIEGQM